MMTGGRGRFRGADGEGGSALIIVMMMVAMLGVLTLTLAALSVNNLTGARRAQEAGVALNAADAGLAQAVAYLRGNGVGALACSPACDGTNGRPDNPWGNSASPATVQIPGTDGASFEVWVEPVAPYPATNPGKYRVHSSGVAGALGYRSVTQDVTMAPVNFPMGLFAKSISAGGSSEVSSQSIFTTGCIYRRSKLHISGTDLLNNIPAGVHSSRIITDDKGNPPACPAPTSSIHSAGYCSTSYPYDQDSQGGPLPGPGCKGAAGAYPQTSLIAGDQDLFTKYNLKSPPFTSGQLDQLKAVAMSQGNYWTSSSGWSSPNETNAVMYFDLLRTDPGGEVNLNSVAGFSRAAGLLATDPACAAKSLVIIVDGGNVGINSNQQLAASLFLLGNDPYGNVQKANGNSTFIGTMYANSIDMTGNAEFTMDNCFKANLSPALLDVQTSNYREVDRVDR